MPGYLLANVKHVHDPKRFSEYSAQTPELIASHGGRYLVRGGEVDPVEVSGPIGRVVVVEFPTFDAAKAYYHGDEYRRLTAIRQSAADADLLLVDGYAG
jgi:uncharacterized protein (DUF1330 family)